jgi:uncharacterized membrane protein
MSALQGTYGRGAPSVEAFWRQRMRGYRKRIEQDLPRWRESGWVTAEGEKAIAAEVAQSGWQISLAPALAILGAVLFGFAVMSFVAANWQEMPKLLRIVLLLGGLLVSYLAAGALFQRGLDAFAHAAILIGVAIFGASIMLISQMYHMEGHPPDAVLLWAAGALLAGLLLRSKPALALAMLLVGLWAGWETSMNEKVFWPFLIGWAAVTAAIVREHWRPGLHLAAVVLALWTITLGYLLHKGHAHGVVILAGVSLMAAGFSVEKLDERLAKFSPSSECYGLAIAFAGLLAQQFVEDIQVSNLVALAVATLAMMIAVIVWGLRSGHRGLLWLGYIGFSIEVLALYFKTVGTLLGSSLFFLMAGALLIALAFLAHRLHARELKAGGMA